MKSRKLTPEEIAVLEAQNCRASDWSTIEVDTAFNAQQVHQTAFSGNVRLGKFDAVFTLDGGIQKPAGIRNATLHNCEIGDNVLIENVQQYIANYKIGDNTLIQNVNCILTHEKSTFGNGVEVAVMNEAGGREVKINDLLTAHTASILALYRHRPGLIAKLNKIIDAYSQSQDSGIGTIGNYAIICNTGLIKDVRIGDHTQIEGAFRLENGTVHSNEHAPAHIGYGVIAQDFIICSGAKVEDGAMLTRCFVGQATQLGHGYSATDSLFFCNCQGENGEACAIFAGPYTVTHHKSTLLIAGMFSFMNAGSGSNQSNHLYKLGPVHQGIMERGGKTASDSYILWSAKIGAFSLVMGRHYNHPDTTDFPFSYLIENEGQTFLYPGINLKSAGTIRDAQKFPKRDNRKDPDKSDQINFKLLSPYTVQKMLRGIQILNGLQAQHGKTAETYTCQGCIIKNSALKNGLNLYNLAIRKYFGNSLISRLENHTASMENIRRRLRPDSELGLGEWQDLSGVFMPKQLVDNLLDDIEWGKITRLEEINTLIAEAHQNYPTYEWTWAWDKMQSYYGFTLETITAGGIIRIVEDWKEAVISLDKMLYEDAKKEFSPNEDIGFSFENHPFVLSLLEHIKEKTELANKVMEAIRKIK